MPDPIATNPVPSAELGVMSLNVRNSAAADGADAWPHRRGLMIRTLLASDPDLLGTQETLADQVDDLRVGLPGWGCVYAGRDDGGRRGESMAMFYRASRFERLDFGHFWLSQTPDRPGLGWDADYPRIASWAVLRDRSVGGSLAWLNTHWDHVGTLARMESAAMIRRWIDRQPAEHAVLITGDFNDFPGSPSHRRLCDAPQRPLIDTFSLLHPNDSDGGGTFHNFTGRGIGRRIDWILCTDHFDVLAAEVDRSAEAGRYPSDHFPLTTRLRWR